MEALQREVQQVKEAPGEFYLIINLQSKQIHLKADANLLRICPILNAGHINTKTTQNHRFINRIDPVTIEPGNANLRHRGRHLPLDFSQRLIEGSRHQSRLYLSPNLLIQAVGNSPITTPHILLAPNDIKALGSALRPGHTAILMPAAPK